MSTVVLILIAAALLLLGAVLLRAMRRAALARAGARPNADTAEPFRSHAEESRGAKR